MIPWTLRINGLATILLGLLLWTWPEVFEPDFGRREINDAVHVIGGRGIPAPDFGKLLQDGAQVVVHPPRPRSLPRALFMETLIVVGVASLLISSSKRSRLQRKASLYFVAGHAFLAFMVWTMMTAWSAPAGFILFDLVVWPIPALLYGLLPNRFAEASENQETSSTEQQIREAAGQEERNRLAQDLHDSVKQQIYSVQTDLATAEARWDGDAVGARAAIERARKTARDAMAEMSALLDRLRRDPIEGVGLVEALRRQCEALGFQTGATVSTAFGDLPLQNLPPLAMTPVFRIAQESLANIARHARAKHVAVRLETERARNALLLEIRDDGCGFDPQSAIPGMGLRNMRLRAQEIGAELEIESKDGKGTLIRLWLPLLDAKRERMEHHIHRLMAVLIPAAAAAVSMILWKDAAPFFIPFLAVGGALTTFHLIALSRLKSA